MKLANELVICAASTGSAKQHFTHTIRSMEASDTKKLKALEAENEKLKKQLAE